MDSLDLQYNYDLLKQMDAKGRQWARSTNPQAKFPAPVELFEIVDKEKRATDFATAFWSCSIGGVMLVVFGIALITGQQGFATAPLIVGVGLAGYGIWARTQVKPLIDEAEGLKRKINLK